MWLFLPDHPLRMRAARIVQHRYFDAFIIGMILLNCVALAAYDPTAEPGDSARNKFLVRVGETAPCWSKERSSNHVICPVGAVSAADRGVSLKERILRL